MSYGTLKGVTVGRRGFRKGAGLAAVVLMLCTINIVVVGTLASDGDSADVAALRTETTRAFYAAEAGGTVVLKLSGAGRGLPAAGSSISVGNGTATFVAVPTTGQPGVVTVQGRSGEAGRRLKLTFGAR